MTDAELRAIVLNVRASLSLRERCLKLLLWRAEMAMLDRALAVMPKRVAA